MSFIQNFVGYPVGYGYRWLGDDDIIESSDEFFSAPRWHSITKSSVGDKAGKIFMPCRRAITVGEGYELVQLQDIRVGDEWIAMHRGHPQWGLLLNPDEFAKNFCTVSGGVGVRRKKDDFVTLKNELNKLRAEVAALKKVNENSEAFFYFSTNDKLPYLILLHTGGITNKIFKPLVGYYYNKTWHRLATEKEIADHEESPNTKLQVPAGTWLKHCNKSLLLLQSNELVEYPKKTYNIATDEEVTVHLLAVANYKGFVVGASVRYDQVRLEFHTITEVSVVNRNANTDVDQCSLVVWDALKKDQYVTVISYGDGTSAPIELLELLNVKLDADTINFVDSGIKIGANYVSNAQLRTALTLFNADSDVGGGNCGKVHYVAISDCKFTKEKLEELLPHLKG